MKPTPHSRKVETKIIADLEPELRKKYMKLKELEQIAIQTDGEEIPNADEMNKLYEELKVISIGFDVKVFRKISLVEYDGHIYKGINSSSTNVEIYDEKGVPMKLELKEPKRPIEKPRKAEIDLPDSKLARNAKEHIYR
ncbi:MAG: hypothetical protein O8C67_11525 [Candidatus Methanoperedens sp.]|nr:hypothetical protein [Candidatus Methanoperedens sp.]